MMDVTSVFVFSFGELYLCYHHGFPTGCMAGQAPEYRAECAVWNNVTKGLDKEPQVTMSCVTNAECTGFDCSGKYIYQVRMDFHMFDILNNFGVYRCYLIR